MVTPRVHSLVQDANDLDGTAFALAIEQDVGTNQVREETVTDVGCAPSI